MEREQKEWNKAETVFKYQLNRLAQNALKEVQGFLKQPSLFFDKRCFHFHWLMH